MNEATSGRHIQVVRLLLLSEGGTDFTSTEADHFAECDPCRAMLQAFVSDHAKYLYRRREEEKSRKSA